MSELPPDHTTTSPIGPPLPTPQGWERLETEHPAVSACAEPFTHPGIFRSNLTLVQENCALGLVAWQEAAEELLPESLSHYRLLDSKAALSLGVTRTGVVRRVAQHLQGDSVAVTLIQWCWISEDKGITLSLSSSPTRVGGLETIIKEIDEIHHLSKTENS